MTFAKGKSGNPAGRPPGAKNRMPTDLRNRVGVFLDDAFDKVVNEFYKLDGAQMVQYYTRLLPFKIPQMKESDVTVDLTRLTDDQLKEVVRGLIEANDKHTGQDEKD